MDGANTTRRRIPNADTDDSKGLIFREMTVTLWCRSWCGVNCFTSSIIVCVRAHKHILSYTLVCTRICVFVCVRSAFTLHTVCYARTCAMVQFALCVRVRVWVGVCLCLAVSLYCLPSTWLVTCLHATCLPVVVCRQ